MNVPFLDLKAQYATIKSEVSEAIAKVLDTCQFTLGDEVEAFEREFATYCQSGFTVGANSGTSALHLALLAAGVGPGDEVITVSCTFIATAAAVAYTGAKPVLVDVDPRSYTMDPALVEAAITERTKVIMPVHLYGMCADMDPIMEIARRRGLVVIEDAAQAHGATYKGKRAGSFGDMACFSFYPGKNLGAYGEGGAVVTKNAEFATKMKMLRDHGQSRKYHHDVVGYNYRLEGIQGAVLRVKLRHLDAWTKARQRHAALYRELLAGSGVRVAEEVAERESVHHIFPMFDANRDQVRDLLGKRGISTGIHYPIPVHLQKAFANLGHGIGSFPHTERVCNETLSLPMYAELTDEMIKAAAAAVRDVAKR